MVNRASGRHPIDAPGTDERTWAAWPWLSTLPGAGPTGLAGVRSAVIVAAHPDDEVLGAGGLISMLAASRARLRLVAVTDGERSHRGHASPAPLARRRTAETDAALRALGARGAEVIRLGLPDGGLAKRQDELAAALAPLVAGFDLCLAPWDHDLHPDHEAAGRRRPRGRDRRLLQLPGLDVALGLPRRPPGALGPGAAGPAGAAHAPAGSARRSPVSPARPRTGGMASGRC